MSGFQIFTVHSTSFKRITIFWQDSWIKSAEFLFSVIDGILHKY
jgi:hypothetical protein